MNWYKKASLKKQASITFTPEGSHQMMQPMNILSICYDISDFGYHKSDILKNSGANSNDIAPDGMSYDQETGTINFYLRDTRSTYNEYTQEREKEVIPPEHKMNEEKIRHLIDAYNNYKAGEIVLEFDKMDISNIKGGPVARINVIKNNTADIERIPELNAANANASKLLDLLGIYGMNVGPEDYSGSFSVNDYIGARQLMQQSDIKDLVRPATYTKEESGPHSYDMGLSLDRFQGYLDRLDEMVAWIQKRNLPDQTIIFG